MASTTPADELQSCIDRLATGDRAARDELIRRACDRLTRLTRTMLRTFPGVHRWEQTDDVFQNASIRLCRALETVTPKSVVEFFRLAALQIRRELIDLARHYGGAVGLGAKHASAGALDRAADASQSTPAAGLDAMQSTLDPRRLASWTEFHEQIDKLPDDEREVFDLIWYQGLSQAEAAVLVGTSERTIQRRWQSARLRLFDAMGGELPGG